MVKKTEEIEDLEELEDEEDKKEEDEEEEDEPEEEEEEEKPVKKVKSEQKAEPKIKVGDIFPIRQIVGFQVVKGFDGRTGEVIYTQTDKPTEAEMLSYIYTH